MKRETVTYKCYFPVSEKWTSKNGRVKLIDVGNVVSMVARSVISSMPYEYSLKATVAEVVHVFAFKDDDDFLRSNGTENYVEVTVTREMPQFLHVRKRILNTTTNNLINDLPKTPFEDVVFRFFQKLGLELCRKLNCNTEVHIDLFHKSYYEHLKLRVQGYQINNIRTAFQYNRRKQNPVIDEWYDVS